MPRTATGDPDFQSVWAADFLVDPDAYNHDIAKLAEVKGDARKDSGGGSPSRRMDRGQAEAK